MFLWRTVENYPYIIPVSPSYLGPVFLLGILISHLSDNFGLQQNRVCELFFVYKEYWTKNLG